MCSHICYHNISPPFTFQMNTIWSPNSSVFGTILIVTNLVQHTHEKLCLMIGWIFFVFYCTKHMTQIGYSLPIINIVFLLCAISLWLFQFRLAVTPYHICQTSSPPLPTCCSCYVFLTKIFHSREPLDSCITHFINVISLKSNFFKSCNQINNEQGQMIRN